MVHTSKTIREMEARLEGRGSKGAYLHFAADLSFASMRFLTKGAQQRSAYETDCALSTFTRFSHQDPPGSECGVYDFDEDGTSGGRPFGDPGPEGSVSPFILR